ncbi:MAG: hypothetical protein RMK89_12690, partial [Armatimonadota bacterium]|nr:hypothetical protein [Armatimonadota bacterium]MDW8144306.1 hypothetical protein [Armatimonadota bacterium]
MDGFTLVRWFVALVAILTIALVFVPNVHQPADAQPVPQDVEILRDVPFGKGGERTLTMHIVRPKEKPEKPMPVIVWIHG